MLSVLSWEDFIPDSRDISYVPIKAHNSRNTKYKGPYVDVLANSASIYFIKIYKDKAPQQALCFSCAVLVAEDHGE